MNIEVKKPVVALTLALMAATLGGCLAKDKTNVDVGDAPAPPTATPNTPPSISGSPGNAIMVGGAYAFTPSASDADGDSLTFSVENLPLWAAFDSMTGELSGQPLVGDDGMYDQIVVSVTDGSDTSSLTPFSITVTQVALGSMELAWTAPAANNDGSALMDLAGFRIYYGVVEGSYTSRVDIDGVGMASIIVDNLLPDTYYVVATAVNETGVESAYSNVVEKVVSGT